MTFFALKFKEIRKFEKLTQQQFADKLGVSRNSIAQIEMGKNTPTTDLLLKILEMFFLTPNYLFDYEENNVSEIKHSKEYEPIKKEFDITEYLKLHSNFQTLYSTFCSLHLMVIELGYENSINSYIIEDVLSYEYLNMNSSKLYSFAQKKGFEKELIAKIKDASSYFIGYVMSHTMILHDDVFTDEDSFFESENNFKKIVKNIT